MAAPFNLNAETVVSRISAPRMARYLLTANGDSLRALQLYAEQARVAAALWQTLGHVEVVMRNAMHDALSQHSASWYAGNLAVVFNQQTRDDIAQARERVSRYASVETPGHVVAELNFGFWRFMLSKHYDRALWTPYLHAAFPHHSGRRDQLFDLTVRINDVRNRIAHHQRLSDPRAHRREALQLAGYICPDAQAWITAECGVLQALNSSGTGSVSHASGP